MLQRNDSWVYFGHRGGIVFKELSNAAEFITHQSADAVKWIITGLCRILPASVWNGASLSLELIATSPGAAVTWAPAWYFYPAVSVIPSC